MNSGQSIMTNHHHRARKYRSPRRWFSMTAGMLLGWMLIFFPINARSLTVVPDDFGKIIQTFADLKDRSSGTAGAKAAAAYIKDQFNRIGLEEVGSIRFDNPVLTYKKSTLHISDKNIDVPIFPLYLNAISPGSTPPQGVTGPLVYVGSGELKEFNEKAIAGAVVLMELDSGKNWLHAASLGAKALIYLDRGSQSKSIFDEKMELTPIRFPRFWMPLDQARELFGNFQTTPDATVAEQIRLVSSSMWETAAGENIYGLIPGSDPRLQEDLLIVEAFYDSRAFVPGRSPGADESCSIVTLLQAARYLKQSPPARSILLVATDGHAQTLAGMREMIWSIRERSKDIRKIKKTLRRAVSAAKKTQKLLKSISSKAGWLKNASDPETGILMQQALQERIKTEVDVISRELMRLRLQEKTQETETMIKALAEKRLLLRRLVWRASVTDLPKNEWEAAMRLVPLAIKDQEAILSDAKRQQEYLRSASAFRALVKPRELAAVVSLHLSSHGDGVGAFNQGWLYPLKPTVDRINAYSTLDEVLHKGAAAVEERLKIPGMYKDTLRPSRRRPWQSYFIDRPHLGGEVSSMAGYIGITLATVHDGRQVWGTPYDMPDRVNTAYASKQSAFVCGLIDFLGHAPALHTGTFPRNGFSTVTGRANFLRHGELFADQPAPGSVILSFQHFSRYHSMVDALGIFRIRGVADKRHTIHKVIIEGYRFDPESGKTIWAIHKKKTGKPAYRVKMQRRAMETDLIMFTCKSLTLFNLLEPRTFSYMTKIKLIDARREAPPLKYWWSRIDTRTSVIASIYLESGTRLKMTLSDTVLRKKLILTHAEADHPEGVGYLVDQWPFLYRTEYLIARDMWSLLAPRIANLETHGIFNEKIRTLQRKGMGALAAAEKALDGQQYDRFFESSKRAWALASRVYDDVEKTQKDVLFGVLFYIALFVPFAFCAERLLFCFSNIYKRIIAFIGIMVLLIAVIYQVHPAFQLAYSPMVVILAFFIMGLSMMVTLIIFFRFEAEMASLQRRAHHTRAEEISRWKAFLASFFLGVSNLRRRRLRTGLTCATLIILTFTIMSFTSVKSMRRHARIRYHSTASYQGVLLKHAGWQSLPPESLGVFYNAFEQKGLVAPRVWLEAEDKTQTTRIPVRFNDRILEAQGLVGLSAEEVSVTGLDQILISGRWFDDTDRRSILLPKTLALNLGIRPTELHDTVVKIWGIPFQVVGIFSGQKLQEQTDLDGEPLTPVTFPSEISMAMTEVEVEALESGEDIEAFQSRYHHVSPELTLIIPHRTLLAAGGQLKGVAVRPVEETRTQDIAEDLVDRFGLSLFSGESDGTYLYNASDTMSYSGVPNIVIPLIISVFIVLNTMIGSVYERKREIGIYTSVGLAPSHVSFLFVAESLAFAVLSVVLGYLVAQTTASFFAGTSLWSGITVNYSSLAGVAAMVLVILVVLVSVIYPSKVAAEIAIPDVNRSWRLPEAKDNTIDVTLPFLMKYHENRGIGGYIYDYFQAHQDVSHGIFSTGEITFGFVCPHTLPLEPNFKSHPCRDFGCYRDTCLELYTDVWLAPFDFGIMQRVEIRFCPSEDEQGFLEIRVRLIRKSGEANAWRRINKAFLNALRKQLLVWRSLDDPSRAHFEQLLMTAYGAEPVKAESTDTR